MDKVITVFFYEVINRIIPGVVFIGFYYSDEVDNAIHRFQNQQIFAALCILLAAWLLGIMLDAITWYPFMFARWICAKCDCKLKDIIGEAKIDKDVDNEREHVRLKCIKQQAEIVMSRSMLLISCFTLLNLPNGFISRYSEWHSYYGWFGIFTFGSIAVYGFINARKTQNATKAKRATDRQC